MGNVCSVPCLKRLNSCCCQCDCCEKPKARSSSSNASTSNPKSAGLVMASIDENDGQLRFKFFFASIYIEVYTKEKFNFVRHSIHKSFDLNFIRIAIVIFIFIFCTCVGG